LEALAAGGIALACLRMLLFDWPAMGFGSDWRFADSGIQLAYRLIAHGSLLALVWGFGRGRIGPTASSRMARGYRVAAVALLFAILSLETRTVTGAFLPAFQAGALSVAWALFAMALVAIGLKADDRPARFTGLILFGIVAVKVFLFDLASLDMIWRVLSFLSVGAVLLLGSFAYLRASKPDPDPEAASDTATAGASGAAAAAASNAKEPA
jgi:uncharacterized membrane protein